MESEDLSDPSGGGLSGLKNNIRAVYTGPFSIQSFVHYSK